jgi:hypothetical protein
LGPEGYIRMKVVVPATTSIDISTSPSLEAKPLEKQSSAFTRESLK